MAKTPLLTHEDTLKMDEMDMEKHQINCYMDDMTKKQRGILIMLAKKMAEHSKGE